MKEYIVQVIVVATDEVEHEIGPMARPRAEKIQRGLNINLDNSRFFTRVVEAPAKKEKRK